MSEILVIAGCSKEKLSQPAPTIELNQGQLFKSISKLVLQNHFDFKILSGKYGFLDPEQVIAPYDQKIKTKADIKRIRKLIHKDIDQIWRDYDKIIVIMGGKYREVLQPYFDNKFYVVFDKRGIGGYKQLIINYLKLTRHRLFKEIKKFQYLECSAYLWSVWDFTPNFSYKDPNRPHCCIFCCFQKDSKCIFSKLYPRLYKKHQEDKAYLKSLSPSNENIIQKVKMIGSKLSSKQKTTLTDFV